MLLTIMLSLLLLPEKELKADTTTEYGQLVKSGTCGNNITWAIYGSNAEYTLVLSGSGEMEDLAFKDCDNLTEVVFTEDSQITSIGRYAFADCSNLTEITLPDSITVIGGCAFRNCSSLTSITIPEGVTRIEGSTFYWCEKLAEIHLPTNLEYIGSYAFWACMEWKNVHIPEGVTTIEENALGACNYTSIVLPPTLTSIGSAVFESCEILKEIYYPSGLDVSATSISEKALQVSYVKTGNNTIKLTIENLPAGTETITIPSEIYGKAISSVDVKGTEVELKCTQHYPLNDQWERNKDEHWFTRCAICGKERETHDFQDGTKACRCGYVPFTISEEPENMQLAYGNRDGKSVSVAVTPAYDTLTITYQWYENDVAITGATSNAYVIPQNKKPGNYTYICKISCGEYYTSTDIEVVVTKATLPSVVPQSSISVDNKTKLVSAVSLPTNWVWCTADRAKTIPAGGKLTVTANYVGADKEYYTTVTKTITITRAACVSSNILYDGTGEKAPSCTSEGIGHKECTVCGDILASNIKVAKVNHTLVKVAKVAATTQKTGMEAHYCCSVCGKLFSDANGKNEVTKASLTIPVIVEEKAPEKETTVKKAPAKGTIIKDKNGNKYKVTKSSLKDGTVSFVAPGNKKASTVKIANTVKINGITYKVTAIEKNAFKNNKYIKKLTIGDNVKTIGANAFYGCTKLKTVTLGKNVTTIDSKAFYKCTSLTSITLPSKVKKIGTSAFYGCKKLETITIKTKLLKSSYVGKNAFKGIKTKATIKLPKSKYATYKTLLCKKGVSKKAKFKKV